jgi:hypothetical protein
LVTITRTGPWLQLAKPSVHGPVVHFSIHSGDAHDVASAILRGVESWAVDGTTSTTMVGELTLRILRSGGVRLAQSLPSGERTMGLDQATAVDLAASLAEVA